MRSLVFYRYLFEIFYCIIDIVSIILHSLVHFFVSHQLSTWEKLRLSGYCYCDTCGHTFVTKNSVDNLIITLNVVLNSEKIKYEMLYVVTILEVLTLSSLHCNLFVCGKCLALIGDDDKHIDSHSMFLQ